MYEHLGRVLTTAEVDDALRRINRDIYARGLDPTEIRQWAKAACPFPHLRDKFRPMAEAIVARARWPMQVVLRADTLCEPQLIYHWSDEPVEGRAAHPDPHIDAEPAWAAGRRYSAIIGVALTDWHEGNGALVVFDGPEARVVSLKAGEAIAISPDQPHTAGYNRSGAIRVGIYFRWLAPAAHGGQTT